MLENLTHNFRKPNVLDIKLGQILYDEQSASPEKIEKMKKAAEKTTSGELGLRLTGFQVTKTSFHFLFGLSTSSSSLFRTVELNSKLTV